MRSTAKGEYNHSATPLGLPLLSCPNFISTQVLLGTFKPAIIKRNLRLEHFVSYHLNWEGLTSNIFLNILRSVTHTYMRLTVFVCLCIFLCTGLKENTCMPICILFKLHKLLRPLLSRQLIHLPQWLPSCQAACPYVYLLCTCFAVVLFSLKASPVWGKSTLL